MCNILCIGAYFISAVSGVDFLVMVKEKECNSLMLRTGHIWFSNALLRYFCLSISLVGKSRLYGRCVHTIARNKSLSSSECHCKTRETDHVGFDISTFIANRARQIRTIHLWIACIFTQIISSGIYSVLHWTAEMCIHLYVYIHI